MLKNIRIENFALIDNLSLEFDPFFNVISGETGSGKSIMVDSLNFVFGERADKTNIRQGQQNMKVTAVFENLGEKIKDIIKAQLDITIENQLILERSYDVQGKNICKINNMNVNTAKLWEVSHMLADIHGQHEHQNIISSDYQLTILDLFGKEQTAVKLKEINKLIDDINEIDKQMQAVGGSVEQKQNLIDLYSYQINEIDRLAIAENEFERLTETKKEMLSYEKVANSLKEFYSNAVSNSYKETAGELLNMASKNLMSIANVSENYLKLYERTKSVAAEFEDISDEVSKIISGLNFSQAEFDRIDGRLDAIKMAYKKYGTNFAAMTEYYNNTKNKLNMLINSEEQLNKLIAKKETILKELSVVQQQLSEIRKKNALNLSGLIEKELNLLGMKNARLVIDFSISELPYSRKGIDIIEFLFSANTGFSPRPLSKVISGGEMSRFMLAYKMVVGHIDQIGTMIFDEIDSGLSGAMADTVAQTLAKLSKQKQIVVITHLPQICAMADKNFFVKKVADNISTKTQLAVLNGSSLYEEIARLMGATNSDNALLVAKDLKQKADNFKANI